MSRAKYQAKLRTLAGFAADEELVHVVEGRVCGSTMNAANSRDGILFATNYRVGVYCESGWFSDEMIEWFGYPDVRTVHSQGPKLRVQQIGGSSLRLEVSSPAKCKDAVAYIVAAVNDVVRSDLWDDFQKAEEHFENGRAELALPILEALQEKCPTATLFMIRRILVLNSLGRLAEALDVARAAVSAPSLDPDCFRVFRGELALSLDLTDETIAVATELYERSGSARSLLLRARARRRANDMHGALLDAEKATTVDPSDLDAWGLLAELGSDRGDAVILKRCVDRLNELGETERSTALTPTLLLAQGDAARAYAAAGSALDQNLVSRFLPRAMVAAAMKLEASEVLDRLTELDAAADGDLYYHVLVVLVMLQHERTKEASDRFSQLQLPDSPWAIVLGSYVAACVHVQSREWALVSSCLADVVKYEQPEWVASESDRGLFYECCALAGWAELELGNYAVATELLRRAESGPPSDNPWLRRALPELVERAAARASLPGSGRPAAGTTTYEVLARLNDGVRQSSHLRVLAERVQRLLDDFDEAPLVAVMGEYSVGKSSFINALIRKPLLPTGEGVTTGTVTVLRYGRLERMRAVFRDGRVVERASLTSIAEFVQETGRSGSAGDLPHHVDVFVDSDVLRTTTVVDTPGLNAPFPEHRQITEGYLAECDAIVWLFNAETAGRSTEKAFLDKLGEHRRKSVGVVNQIDLVPKDELEDVLDGVRQAFGGTFSSVHPVSAKRALTSLVNGDEALSRASGMPQLLEWLEGNVLTQARPIKEAATREKVRATLSEVRALREAFDTVATRQLEQVQAAKADLKTWIDRELATDIATAIGEMRQGLEEAIRVAAATASEGTGRRTMASGDFAGVGRDLMSSCRVSWSEAIEAVLARYDNRAEQIDPTIDALAAPEWQGVLDASRRALRLSFQSWRKDLLDYAEQLDAYASGYVEGGGLYLAYESVPWAQRDQAEQVRAGFRLKLSFLWERAQVGLSRWTMELRANTDEEFTRLDREIRTEVARVRDTSFRKVEHLGLLLDSAST